MKTIRILSLIIITALFRKSLLPHVIEKIDHELTVECTPKQREQVVGKINTVLHFWLVREILEYYLNKTTAGQKIDLDNEEIIERHTRYIPDHESRVVWHNWMKTHYAEPLAFKIPGNGPHKDLLTNYQALTGYDFEGLNSVKKIVQDAESHHLRVRTVASGHALSDVAVTTDILISSKKMNLPQRKADQEYIKEAYRHGYEVTVYYGNRTAKEQRYLFETGAGTILVDLKQILEKYGYALQNLGGSDVQGFMGAVATSTHGSGIGLGPFPDFVKSMVLVTGNGRAIRLEPKDGITDRAKYEKSPEYTQHQIELVQDDDQFYAALVSFGSMGVVFSVVIEVQDLYYLKEERIPGTWEEEKEKLLKEGMDYVNAHRHFELTINPFPLNEQGDWDTGAPHFCLITQRNYCEPDPSENVEDNRRNYLSSLLSGITFAGNITAWIFNRKPENIPRLLMNSLQRIADHKEYGGGYRGLYYNVLNQGLREMKFHGYAIEIGFDVEDHTYIHAIDRMIEIIRDMAQNYNQYQAAPLAVRFVNESPAYMSMMYQRKSAMIEVVSLNGVVGGREVLERIEREMFQYGGRPHWGLNYGYITRHNELMDRLYPKFREWMKVKNDLDPQGTFNNVFTDRSGISTLKLPKERNSQIMKEKQKN